MKYYITPNEVYTRHSEGDFITLNDGSILFAYSRFHGGKADGAPCDIVGILSQDKGETWSESYVMISAETFGVSNVMSVSFMRMQNGDLGVFFIAKFVPGHSKVILARSNDEGKTFYKNTECTYNQIASYYVLNNSRVIRTQSGRIIIPLACHGSGVNSAGEEFFNQHASVMFLFSDDDGETFERLPCTLTGPINSKSGLQEPGIIELKNGVLWAYFRTDMMYQYESYSMDGGQRWTTPQPSRFTSPCSPMKIARDKETDMLVAIWNPIPRYNGRKFGISDRTPFVWAISYDDGRTWGEASLIEDDYNRGFCYPAIHFLGNGEMLISYCSGGEKDGTILSRTTINKIKYRD